MQITSIEQAKKNINRVNLFLDGEFWVGLDKNDLLEFQLHKNKTISEEEKKEIEKTSQLGKIRTRILNYTMLRPHSKREILDHFILKKEIDRQEIQSVLDELEEKSLISDLEFAKWYMEGRLASGKHGVNKIRAELMKKGVSSKFIEIAIYEKTSTEEFEEKNIEQIKEYIQKVSRSIKSKDDREFKNKLIQRLMSRGFKYDDIKSALKIEED
ncbi:MAG: RecX family transcriptional regulator [Candidatus Dojkabacteria bacterium]